MKKGGIKNKMRWVHKKIKSYKQGKKPTFLEKFALAHANPVSFMSHIFGALAIIYGLWVHDFIAIGGGIILFILGHLNIWFSK